MQNPNPTPTPGALAPSPLPDLTPTAATARALYDESAARSERLTAAVAEFEARVAEAGGALDAALYAEGLDLAGKITKTRSYMENARKPITQAFDAVRAAFIALEAPADPKKTGTPAARLQHLLNAYAAEETRRREAQARELQLREAFRADLARAATDHLWLTAAAAAAGWHRQLAAATTAAQLDKVAAALADAEIPEIVPLTEVLATVPAPAALLPEAVAAERGGALALLTERWEGWPAQCQEALAGVRARVAVYRATLKERRDAAKAGREVALPGPDAAEEAARRAAEQEAAVREATAETGAALAAVVGAAPRVKRRLRVEVTAPAGWLPLLALFVEHQGAELAPAAWPALTMERVARWAAAHAEATGELVDHPGVRYEEEIKARR